MSPSCLLAALILAIVPAATETEVRFGLGGQPDFGVDGDVNSSFPGLLKTIFRLLGMPPLNLYDAAAADLSEVFTSAPDFRPFKALRPDADILLPEQVKDPLDPVPQPAMLYSPMTPQSTAKPANSTP